MRAAALLFAFVTALVPAAASAEDVPQQFLVIVVDGLRPDYITRETMPTLYRLGEQGVFFENHHSVIPTVTRVNAASFATGSYPETHGLMGNSVYFPSVDPQHALNTSDYENLKRIHEAEGRLLTATTIGEVLDAAGKQYLVISSGSTGSSYLLNPNLNGAGIINVDVILPDALRERVESKIGPAPADDIPSTARIAWTVDTYIQLALAEIHPDVTFLWMTDPDHTAHAKGIGAPETVASLRGVDEQIARIVKAHEDAGLADRINVLVTSDHGFSTHTGGINLALFLQQNGFASGVHVADGAIYVDGHDPARIEAIVVVLQQQRSIGPIFTHGDSARPFRGSVPGTLSFHAIHWQHDRSADIVVFPDWDDQLNPFGFAGQTASGGVAGHGSTGRADILNTFIAAGPSFKQGVRSKVPSGNTDLAPTLLGILGLERPSSMNGRPLTEALIGGSEPGHVAVSMRHVMGDPIPGFGDGRRLFFQALEVDTHFYVDFARVAIVHVTEE